jgi:hypothetical protein
MRRMAFAVSIPMLSLLFVVGCSKQRVVQHSSREIVDQFSKKIDEFLAVIDAAPLPAQADQEDFVVDLRHRVGTLEDLLESLFYLARDNGEAQAPLGSTTRTLAEARKATEGTPHVAELREALTKLKKQIAELPANVK